MKKAKIAGMMASVILLALLTGCATQTAVSQTESESTSASSASLSVSAGSSGSVPAKSQVASSAPPVSSGQAVVSSILSRPQTGNTPANTAPSNRETTPAATTPEKPAEPAPVTAEAPTQTQASAPQPTSAPPPAPSPTLAPPPAPAFDVSQWVNLGISYGQSIGLEADSSVTGSWDNPIIAGPSSQYLERDICGMLDWYNASGFTRFWVWASPRGDGKFDIFIGYS